MSFQIGDHIGAHTIQGLRYHGGMATVSRLGIGRPIAGALGSLKLTPITNPQAYQLEIHDLQSLLPTVTGMTDAALGSMAAARLHDPAPSGRKSHEE